MHLFMDTFSLCYSFSIAVPLQASLKLSLDLLQEVCLHLCSDQTGREAELTLLDVWSAGQEE